MFDFFKKKTTEQKAVEYLAQHAKQISKNKLGPLGVILDFTNEIKESKLHQELNIISEKELLHSQTYYMCASLMLLSYLKSGTYDSLQNNDVDIEEIARYSYVACSRIITDDTYMKIIAGSASNFTTQIIDDEKKYLIAWENWLNNLDVLKNIFR